MDPIRRSAYGFCQGLDGLEMTSPMPMPATRRRKMSPYTASRSLNAHRGVVREGFYDLLRRPLRGRMLRDIEMDDPSAVVREQHEDEQDSASERWDGKEVHRHERRHVIR